MSAEDEESDWLGVERDNPRLIAWREYRRSKNAPPEPQESYWLVELDDLSFRFTKGGTEVITCALNDPLVDKHKTEAEAIKWGETLERRSPWMEGRWKALEHMTMRTPEPQEAAPQPNSTAPKRPKIVAVPTEHKMLTAYYPVDPTEAYMDALEAQVAQLRAEMTEKDKRLKFQDDRTPLPCGCPTFYLYMAEGRIACGQCGKAYSAPPSERDIPTKESANDNQADVRVVRLVDRGVLGQEEANLVPLPITDDRNFDYVDPRLREEADLIVKASERDTQEGE